MAITSYTYDANGNRLFAATQSGSFAATYNERDQMLTYGDTSYTYSSDGELLRSSAASGDTTYSFDVHGALRAVTLPNGGQVEYVLDPSRWRIGKCVNGAIVQRRLYGQALEVLADLDASGNVEARYVFMNRFGSTAYMTTGDRTYRILSDHLGSARLVVDVSTGEIAQALNYNEWGSIILDTNPGFQPFAFTGREWDPEIGLYYYRARYYDPKVGRFISEDPIGFGGGVNYYGYVQANPLSWIDPFGWVQYASEYGTTPDGLTQNMLNGVAHFDAAFQTAAGRDVVVTYTTNGQHSPNSLHYSGNACDLRTRDLTVTQRQTAAQELRRLLGADFDVLDEGDHFHVEYDPPAPTPTPPLTPTPTPTTTTR